MFSARSDWKKVPWHKFSALAYFSCQIWRKTYAEAEKICFCGKLMPWHIFSVKCGGKHMPKEENLCFCEKIMPWHIFSVKSNGKRYAKVEKLCRSTCFPPNLTRKDMPKWKTYAVAYFSRQFWRKTCAEAEKICFCGKHMPWHIFSVGKHMPMRKTYAKAENLCQSIFFPLWHMFSATRWKDPKSIFMRHFLIEIVMGMKSPT